MSDRPNRPHILWICADQQRYDTIHALGNGHIRTPNLDRLASEGVAFTRAYSQSPICTPSRAALLTGCYPSTVHVNRNGNDHFPDNFPLVTRMLADAGYDCGLAGKLHLSAAHGRVEARPDDGYRVFKWSHHPRPEVFWPTERHDYQQWLTDQGAQWDEIYPLDRGTTSVSDPYMHGVPTPYHQTTWCIDETLDFIGQPRSGPWLMSVNPFDPHPPFDPPAEYLERMDIATMPLPLFRPEELDSQRAFAGIDHQTRIPIAPESFDARRMVAAYYAQIELLDDQIGRLLHVLEEAGERENTLIIFTSDHGEMLGDHGLRLKGCRFYDGAVRVPLVISWPGRFGQGEQSDALVELIDLMPTLLDAAGLPTPAHVQGQSILPLLTGRADLHRHRDFVRCEYHDAIQLPDGSHANMIFDGRHKLVVYHGHGIGELYDHQTDPKEFVNLWDDPTSETVKWKLVATLFDAAMLATDPGQVRVGPY